MSQKITILTMQQALIRRREFDTSVIEESDECVLKYGCIIDSDKEQAVGYCDLMQSRTILLTAKVGNHVEDIFVEVFSVQKDS